MNAIELKTTSEARQLLERIKAVTTFKDFKKFIRATDSWDECHQVYVMLGNFISLARNPNTNISVYVNANVWYSLHTWEKDQIDD